MARIVQKYGGTSVGTIERIQNVADRLIQTFEEGNQVVAVISAMSGITDSLIKLAYDISRKPTPREMDVLLATGEQQSIALLTMALNQKGYKALSFTGNQAGFSTYGNHTHGRIATIDASRVTAALDAGYIAVCAGFQGVNETGDVQTLGRGGSDLSAIAMAQAVNADVCQILTDVDGVYTCDPRIVSDAQKIPVLSYDEMLEMASSGSKVMQARSVEFAKKYDVVFEVRNSMNKNPGTIVRAENTASDRPVISITPTTKMQGRITVLSSPCTGNRTSILLDALAKAGVTLDMILANAAHEGRIRHSFTMDMEHIDAAKQALLQLDEVSELEEKSGLSKISVVGEAMRNHPGVAAKMFGALAAQGIETGIISTSEIHISTTVASAKREQAVHCLHKVFSLDTPSKEASVSHAPKELSSSISQAKTSTATPSCTCSEIKAMESPVVNEISRTLSPQACITISHIEPRIPYTSIILNALAEAKINIDMIVSNTAYQGHARQSITLDTCDLESAMAVLESLVASAALGADAQLESLERLVKISAIGVGIRSHPEVAAKIFKALADAQIQTHMVSTSEINISTTVAESVSQEAIRCLRHAFDLGES